MSELSTQLARLERRAAKLFEQAYAGDLQSFEEYLEVVDELILVLSQATGPAH